MSLKTLGSGSGIQKKNSDPDPQPWLQVDYTYRNSTYGYLQRYIDQLRGCYSKFIYNHGPY